MDGDNDMDARCDIGAFEVITQMPYLSQFKPPIMDEAGVLSIGPEMLEILDADTTSDFISYTLRTQPFNGAPYLQLTQPLSAGQVFTQTSINVGNLAFIHDGSETFWAQFDFIATDQERVPVRLISNGPKGPSNGNSTAAAISANGRYIAFESDAYNFYNLAQTNIYVYDRQGWGTSNCFCR